MRNGLYFFIFFLLSLQIACAEKYHFVSIENLVEQEVGRIIIPEIYKRLNITVTISPRPGKRAQQEACSGKMDGEIMRIWSYGEENPDVIRIPTPYYYLETMAFINKNSGIRIDTKENLEKYRLVKVRGVKHTDNITAGMPTVHEIKNTEYMMRFLHGGRADIALTNTLDGILMLKKLAFTDITPLDKPFAVLDLYHYIHKDHKKLVPEVDALIKEMKNNGEMKTLIRKAENQVTGG